VTTGAQMIPGWQPDLVLCAGDMVAGQKLGLTEAELEAMWAAFDRLVFEPIRAAGLPFALTLGNHDASASQQGGEYVFDLERRVAARYWREHQSQLRLSYLDSAHFPFYYSFLHQGIFYLVWDASSATIEAQQVAWAEQVLASEVAQNARMRVVMGHLPLYAVSQGRDRNGEILNQAAALQAILERYRVHTYISGHHHAYFPGHMNTLELLHCGALGSGPRSWLGRTDAAMQTLTVLDIFLEQAQTVYTTYNMNTLQVVNLAQVPRQIIGPTGRVLRRDLTAADLTADERNQTYSSSGN
jgi:3',5'-cyclic AMP phosphodiesterase CpdA